MPETWKHYLYVFNLFSLCCSLQFYMKCQELLTQLSQNLEYFLLYLWSFHCCTIRCESLLKKRINIFWDTVIFSECKDLNKQSSWTHLRIYSCFTRVGTTTFLISPKLCPRGQSSAPFAGLCIFHLLSEVDIIKKRTWKIMYLNPPTLPQKNQKKNLPNYWCSASSHFYRKHQTVWFCFS